MFKLPRWCQSCCNARLNLSQISSRRATGHVRLQDVPSSIAVVDGRVLRNLNLTEATDLQFLAVGLGLGDANTPRGAGFRVRGVGTVAFADGIEQSVGSVVDGVRLARAGQGLADLIDIERIEVLRGPQGMLFGRNAPPML